MYKDHILKSQQIKKNSALTDIRIKFARSKAISASVFRCIILVVDS